ncbi:hypothetical protein WJX72_011208 [[Myrmecia] bisecta]|uniref:Class II aldolase/adducin N-terminal domain-containing protein n=1 Tax=[Myrmecia] bisecta TaxID=41462 RepID=A0AAW1R9K3_9CHLO
MAPSGVQKERMVPEDLFVLDHKGDTLHTPRARPAPYSAPKLSECSPLFMAAYELRGAGAVLHSHSINSVLATLLDQNASEFKVTHLEMIKGIAGHGYYGNCVVPIIENTARECELTDRLRDAIKRYPEANAVLVRRHGVYVWGKTWIQAKTQAECYDYLFEAAVRMAGMGIDASRPSPPLPLANGANGHIIENGGPVAKKLKASHRQLPTAIVLDIEGTVAPITFVSQTLFPYAARHLLAHLQSTFDSAETQEDIQLLRQLGADDVKAGRAAALIPAASNSREVVIAACVKSVEAQMATDRKTTALKSLQGHIWRQGFQSGELKVPLYQDVPDALVQWRNQGIKTYIYSSGSRDAQKNLFGHTTVGDLRPHLMGFFDTTSGAKVESASYKNIAASLGVDEPSQVLFATDVVAEADAATAAGWQVALVTRPGNAELPAGCKHRVISSLAQLLQ